MHNKRSDGSDFDLTIDECYFEFIIFYSHSTKDPVTRSDYELFETQYFKQNIRSNLYQSLDLFKNFYLSVKIVKELLEFA